jgi:hypothetical protein
MKTALAKQFADNVVECERRNDFGGLHAQAIRDFKEETFRWADFSGKTVGVYVLPNGRKVRDVTKAIAAS